MHRACFENSVMQEPLSNSARTWISGHNINFVQFVNGDRCLFCHRRYFVHLLISGLLNIYIHGHHSCLFNANRKKTTTIVPAHECAKASFKPLTPMLTYPARPGPEVIKMLSCSTQLSTKFQLLIKTKIPTNEEVSCFKYLRCCIYQANKC